MGCWNGTCMISHLPIIAGEKVKVIILHSYKEKISLTGSAFCYSTGLMFPAFLSFTAEYNDYGSVENILEDWNTKLILESLKEYFGNKIKVEDEIKEEYTLEDIIYGIERGSLKSHGIPFAKKKNKETAELMLSIHAGIGAKKSETKEFNGFKSAEEYQHWFNIANEELKESWNDPGLAFVMIRQDIWDTVVEKASKMLMWGDDKVNGDKYGRIPLTRYVNNQFINALKEPTKKILKDKEIRKDFCRIFDDSYAGSGHYLFPGKYKDVLFDGIVPVNEIEQQYLENNAVQFFLEHIRTPWMIQSGAGSQSECWDDYKVIAQKIIEICEQKIAERGIED